MRYTNPSRRNDEVALDKAVRLRSEVEDPVRLCLPRALKIEG